MPTQASQDGGTGSQPTVVKGAKEVFGLLLDQEDKETRETPPNAEPAPEPAEPEADPEPVEDAASPDAEPTPEPGADEPESDPDAEPTPEIETYEVKIDGKVERHTLDELRNGYSRTEAFTRKSMALAEERKAFEADRVQAREVRDEYAAALDKIGAALDSMLPAEPDWEERKRVLPPDQYAAEYTDHQRLAQKRRVVADEQRRVKEEQLRESLAHRQQLLVGEGEKLVAAIPAWSDPAKRTEEFGHVVTYLRDMGYSPEQIEAIDDHRVVLVARKAMAFDKLQAEVGTTAEKVRPKIKPATPGAHKRPVKTDPKKVARDTLKRTGRVTDATPIFESLMGE